MCKCSSGVYDTLNLVFIRSIITSHKLKRSKGNESLLYVLNKSNLMSLHNDLYKMTREYSKGKDCYE